MSIIVTGAAGFIGSNLVKALNARGQTDIIAVDNLKRADKVANLADLEITDFVDKQDFLEIVRGGLDGEFSAVLHQGACSDTMETDGRYMMENNYRYSLELMDWAQEQGIAFIYASSASVYGAGKVFSESREHESPLNVYGYSKFLFDQVVRRRLPGTTQIAGFRYFNVYGPREAHKGRMASVAFHFFNQYRESGKVVAYKVETQKTRAATGDPTSRYYGVDQYHILGVCLGKKTGDWRDFLYIRTIDLIAHAKHAGKLAVMQRVPLPDAKELRPWYADLAELLLHIDDPPCR